MKSIKKWGDLIKKQKAVFFDRDGVLIRADIVDNKPLSIRHLNDMEILPGTKELIARLVEAKFLVFIITNQPDIARGKLTAKTVDLIHRHLLSSLGGPEFIQKIYMCPHDDSDGCSCRKPKPGMILEAAAEYDINLKRSYVVGDRAVDIAAGIAAGCRTILMDASYNRGTEADYHARDLSEAAEWIIKK